MLLPNRLCIHITCISITFSIKDLILNSWRMAQIMFKKVSTNCMELLLFKLSRANLAHQFIGGRQVSRLSLPYKPFKLVRAKCVQYLVQRRANLAWNSWSQALWCQNFLLDHDWAFASNCCLAWFLLGMEKILDILAWFLLGKKYVSAILLDSYLKTFWQLNSWLNISW